MIRLRASWEYLRGTYWAVPSAMSLAAVILSFGMIQLDEAVTATLLERLAWVYTGGAEGARAVLSTIAGSMITVAGVTFSITIVALTLASQQFGPRLLRNFLRDLGNQVVLGTFVSTFLYCLLVLRTVRGADDLEFVPHLAVTLGVVLAMISLGVLIFFIHHVATSIQASQIIAKVASELQGATNHLFPHRLGHAGTDAKDPGAGTFLDAAAGDSGTVRARTAGYVQAVDGERLIGLARKQDVSVRMHVRPGAFVQRDSALMSVRIGSRTRDWGEESFRAAVLIGAERTGTQDVEFFIHQLVELAVRALSPGINDPATARSCIDRLEQALCDLASRQFPSNARYDGDHTLRVITSQVTFATLVDSAFAEIGRYGASSVSVTCRLLDALSHISACVSRRQDGVALADLAAAIMCRTRRMEMAARDRESIEQRHGAVQSALASTNAPSVSHDA